MKSLRKIAYRSSLKIRSWLVHSHAPLTGGRSPARLILFFLCVMIGLGNSAETSAQLLSSLGAGFTYGQGEASSKLWPYPTEWISLKGPTIRRAAWLEARLPLSNGSRFFLGGRVSLAWSAKRFAGALSGSPVLLPDSVDPVYIGLSMRFEQTMTTYEAEPTIGWRPGVGIELEAGPTIGAGSTTSSPVYQSLTGTNARFSNPNGYPELDSGRTLIINNGERFSGRSISLGAVVRAAYSIPFSGPLAVKFEVEGRSDFLPPVSELGTSWQDYSLGAGISLTYTFGLSGSDEKRGDLLDAPPPGASIDLYAINDDGTRAQTATIRSEPTTHDRRMRPVPAVGFAPGSADIHPDYIQVKETEKEKITIDSLTHLDPIDLQRHILNVTGLRLQSGETPRVRLVPGGDDPKLGDRRAAAIAAYLIDVWGCSPAAVTIAEDTDRREGMGADDIRIEGLFKGRDDMLNGSWTEVRHAAPRIHVEPEIEAETGVKEWAIVFRHGDREVARQSSDGLHDGRLNVAMVLADMKEGIPPAPLTVELQTIDSAGRSAEARDELPFETESGSTETITTWLLTDSEVETVLPGSIEGEITVTPSLTGAPTTVAERIASRLRTSTGAAIRVTSNTTETSLPSTSPITRHLTETILITASP